MELEGQSRVVDVREEAAFLFRQCFGGSSIGSPLMKTA